MRTIGFTDFELLEITNFYKSELIKATKRIEEIKIILSQLDIPIGNSSNIPATKSNSNDRNAITPSPASYTASLPRAKRNQNRKTTLTKKEAKSIMAKFDNSLVTDSANAVKEKENNLSATTNQLKLNGKWIKFIVGLLERHNRVIAAEDIVSEAIYLFDVPDEKQRVTKQVIYNTLYKLDLSKKLIGSCTVHGRKGKWYGLRKWFTAEGEIKESFLVKTT